MGSGRGFGKSSGMIPRDTQSTQDKSISSWPSQTVMLVWVVLPLWLSSARNWPKVCIGVPFAARSRGVSAANSAESMFRVRLICRPVVSAPGGRAYGQWNFRRLARPLDWFNSVDELSTRVSSPRMEDLDRWSLFTSTDCAMLCSVYCIVCFLFSEFVIILLIIMVKF